MNCLIFFFIEAGEESPSSLSPPPDGGSNEWELLPPNFHNSGNKQTKINWAHHLQKISDFNFGQKMWNVARGMNFILIANKPGTQAFTVISLVSSTVKN